jgi:mono/diheme cytochrome c family protein
MNDLDAWRSTGRRALRVARQRGWLSRPRRGPNWLAKTLALVLGSLSLVSVLATGTSTYQFLKRDVPEQYLNPEEHFKYGSIGAEGGAGIPYWLWLVLPQAFPEYLPDQPGSGYARLGFVYEPGHQRPIGTSVRDRPIELLGLNCAVCHVGTIQDARDAPARFVLGMPSHQLNLQGYLTFLFRAAQDDRFNADVLLPLIQQVNPRFSWFDRLIYRYIAIPRTRAGLLRQAQSFTWLQQRPPFGPGRVDTFNPYKVRLGISMAGDDTIGTADLPSLWHQRVREHMWLHWDGNNNAVEERNKSAALGAGATEASLDLANLQRVADWIWELRPPEFPRDKINTSLLENGRRVYAAQCAECHALDGRLVGQVVPIGEIGTDPERLNSFTPELAVRMNTLGTGYSWKFSHFRKTDGYANQPLDGIWLRAPYLHNGSVPTLRDLLKPPEQRPTVFYAGYPLYDYANVGFVTQGEEAERRGFRYDTRVRGNGNQGHTYGTDLNPADVDALLEYLKTL